MTDQTDRPYTEEDLRSAAALMHYAMTTEPNPADADSVLSGHPAWAHVEVGSDEEDQLRESVVELVSGAPDISRWAVDLGVDGLRPDVHTIDVGWDDGPLLARLLIAFAKDMPDDEREQLAEDVRDAVAPVVPVRDGRVLAVPAGQAPATDQTEFRDRIAAALLARIKRATVSRQQPYDAVTSLLAAPRLDKDPA